VELRQSQGCFSPPGVPRKAVLFFWAAAAAGEADSCEEGKPCDSAGGYAAQVGPLPELSYSLENVAFPNQRVTIAC